MSYMKLLCLNMLIYLSILGWMTNNWLMIWLLMEVVFVLLMGMFTLGKNYSVVELMMKYFIIQVFFSMLFFISILFYMVNFMIFNNWCLVIFLLIKLGLFPFHFWLIMILGKLEWISFYILNSFSKLLPILLWFYMFSLSNFSFLIFSSLLVGSIAGLNNLCLQKILGYSSIVHLCWLLYSIELSLSLFYFYYISYLFMLAWFINVFTQSNVYFLNQVKFSSFSLIMKFIMFFFILSIGGFPPFSGFIMKLLVTYNLMLYSLKFLVVLLIWFGLFSVFYYFQMFYYTLFLFSFSVKWFNMEVISLGVVSFMILLFYFVLFFIY